MKYSHVTKKRLWLSFPKVSRKTFCSKPAYLFPAYDPGGSYSREVKVTQSCPTLCNPRDCTVHGILQDRILEWVAFPFSWRRRPFSWRREKLPTPVFLSWRIPWACQATVHGITKSQTWLSDFHFHFMIQGRLSSSIKRSVVGSLRDGPRDQVTLKKCVLGHHFWEGARSEMSLP